MRATVQPVEGNAGASKVKLSVELDDEEMDRAVSAAVRKLSREVRVPGFRPGKVPRRYLEARMGADVIRQEALREALPDLYAQALRDTEVDAIAPPEIDITSGEESGPVAFDATVEVRPTVTLAGYEGLAVTLPGLEVQESEVDAEVDRLRGQFGELVSVGRPARDGDYLTIDVKAYRHSEIIEPLTNEDLSYEVGSGSIVAELDDQLRDKRPGDILKFNAKVGPEEISFQVLVKDVREKILPEANDAWAADASEFDTLEELRADLRQRLARAKKLRARMVLRDRALEALMGLVDIEPPETLVNAEMENRAQDLGQRLMAQGIDPQRYLATQDPEALTRELREVSARSVVADLALRALCEAESIAVTDEDVDAELAALAERAGQQPERVRRDVERSGQLPALRSNLRKAKALTWLAEHVELVDEEGKAISREELFQDEGGGRPLGEDAEEAPPGEAGASAEPSTSVEKPA
jgi:trigger factor